MKLRRLYIGDFRVLSKLEIPFAEARDTGNGRDTYEIDLLVGKNGSGKSTVLQALAIVLRQLEAGGYVPFPYELDYELTEDDGVRRVVISNLPRLNAPAAVQPGSQRILVNGSPVQDLESVLPRHIVAFTTGSELEWEYTPDTDSGASHGGLVGLSLKDASEREFPADTAWPEPAAVEAEIKAMDRFVFIRSAQLPFLILSGLLAELSWSDSGPRLLEEVYQQTRIRRLTSFSLRFRLADMSPSEQADVRVLASRAARCLRLGLDVLLVFDLCSGGPKLAKELLRDFGGPFQFFLRFGAMLVRGASRALFREVNVVFEQNSAPGAGVDSPRPPLLMLDWLSDGERSLLARICLLVLLRGNETLVLLDEPEVHFNDFWKRQLVLFIDRVLAGQKSHVLIATHSSIALTDVHKQDIVLLERNGPYTSYAKAPSIETFGGDPSEIMVHVFEAPFATGQRSVRDIEAALRDDSDPVTKAARLNRLLANVSPGYWSFRIRRELAALEPESDDPFADAP